MPAVPILEAICDSSQTVQEGTDQLAVLELFGSPGHVEDPFADGWEPADF